MRPRHHSNLRSTAILVTLAAFAAGVSDAYAFSSGNGGSQPPGEYHSTLPTLGDGQTGNTQLDNRGRLIISPSSYPTQQPVSPATGYTFPVSTATTWPVHEQGTANVNVTFPTVQAVAPAPSASPFPITPASGSQFTVNGTVNVGNYPGVQLVGPTASNTAFNVNCVSGCPSGGGSGSSTSQGVYNAALPTYTSGQTVTAQYDQNGRAIISPFTISLPGPLPVADQYNTTLPVLTNGAYQPPGIDSNGLTLLSPQSNIQTGGGIYQLNAPPLADGQVTQVRVDAAGNTMVRAATPLPITVEQAGNPIDRSNKIALASTSQIVMPYDPTRRGFTLQNTSGGDLWINLLGGFATAGSPAFKVPTFTTFTTPPFYPASNPVTIYGATVNATYSVISW
jgi:hypothetical protein